MSVKVKFKIGEKKGITANYTVRNDNPIRTIFKINAASASFYSLTGSPYDNANLKDALDLKADKSELDADIEIINQTINENYNTLDNKIDIVQSDLSGDISTLETEIQNEVATRAENDTLLQGDINTLRNDLTSEISNRTSADNTLQDNIDTLASDLADEVTARENADTTLQGNINTLSSTVTSNYNTLDGKITTLSGTVSSNYNTLDTKIDNTKSAIDSDISDLSDTVNQNYTDLNNAITTSASTINSRIDTEVNTLNTAITTENTQRQAADSNLQSQIDAITSASDVFDIVGTYAELEAYDISTVPPNDIIKVLIDSTHNNAATYYRCVENDGVKSWTYIGSEGAYYTKSESDNTFVTKTTTINNKPLSNNITLTASDVNALPADTVIGSGVITLQKNGADIDSFNVNATANKSINISVPTDTSDLTNNAGYITGINQADVLDALGFTPYNASNPDGFITSADLPTNYVTTDTAQDISGRKTFLGEKAIYFKQVATSNKLGFTLYNPSNTELAALEYRPNTINGASLLALNCPQTTGGYVGFRYWGSPAVNIVAPKVATAGNYFMATHITDGTNTVTASNTGTVNISTLLPDVSGFATQTWVQNQNYITSAALTDYVTNTSLATTLADYVTNSALTTTLADYALSADIPTKTSDLTNDSGFITNSALTTTLADYALLTDIPTVPTTDQTYDGTSANPQSGLAIEGELDNYVKNTHNGSGLTSYIDYVSDEPIMQYEDSSYIYSVSAAHDTACLYAKNKGNNNSFVAGVTPTNFALSSNGGNVFISIVNSKLVVNGDTIATVSDIPDTSNLANKDLSNLSTTGQAVIDGKVSKSGDTMTGALNLDMTTVGSSNENFQDITFTLDDINRAGLRCSHSTDGTNRVQIIVRNNSGTFASGYEASNNNGTLSCSFPDTTCVDGQWQFINTVIMDNVSVKGSSNLTYTLSDVPNDGHMYEVMLAGNIQTGTTSGNFCALQLRSDFSTGAVTKLCNARTRSSSFMQAQGTVIIPLTSSRKIYVSRNAGWEGTAQLWLIGYRRIGTNS